VEAIIRSMTPAERAEPQLINGSRRNRIAVGSGTSPTDVNRLVKQFSDMQKMMKRFGLGGGGGGGKAKKGKRRAAMAGLGGLGAGGFPDLSELTGGLPGGGGSDGGHSGGGPAGNGSVPGR